MVRLRSRAGFTILDLMIVVVIIGVIAALAAPTVGLALADQRTNRAAIDVVRMFREARSDALMYGRASVLDYDMLGSAGGIRSRIRVFRGVTSSCNTNDWGTIIQPGCGAADGAPACIADLRMDEYDQGGFATGLTSSAGAAARWCFQPSGAVMIQDAVSTRFRETGVDGGWSFRLRRNRGGTPEGTERVVSVPLGGDARLRR